eukprot:6184836-Pleurochrysis_carterae.AAC.4
MPVGHLPSLRTLCTTHQTSYVAVISPVCMAAPGFCGLLRTTSSFKLPQRRNASQLASVP